MKRVVPKTLNSIRIYGKSPKIVFLLAGWKTRQWMYWLPAQILVLNGYRCVVYSYDDKVFSPNAELTVKSLAAIRDNVLAQIKRFKVEGCKDFSILSFSLGTMIAFMVADKSPDVDRFIVNLTSVEPAEAVWTWDKINIGFKRGLKDQHITLDKLRELWAPIAPANNMTNLQGKQVLIYLAKNDPLMPYEKSRQIIGLVEKAGCKSQVVINKRGGHALAGFWNLANARPYLQFLNQAAQLVDSSERSDNAL